jgi:hypothetical protein
MTAREHNNLLGILIMVQGGLVALIGILLGFIYGGVGAAMLGSARRDEEQLAGGAVMAFGIMLAIVMIGIAAFDLFTGAKIRKVAPIGRILGIIVSILSLFSFPLGTALGVYGLWFLFGDMGKSLYLGSQAPSGGFSPPPPNSWQ